MYRSVHVYACDCQDRNQRLTCQPFGHNIAMGSFERARSRIAITGAHIFATARSLSGPEGARRVPIHVRYRNAPWLHVRCWLTEISATAHTQRLALRRGCPGSTI